MQLVAAYATSHAGLIVTRRAQAPEDQVANVYSGFDRIRREITALEPDAIVIIATDHQKAFPLEGVPQFSIGVGPVARGLGDAGIPPCEVPVHQELAQAVLDGCVDRHADLAFTEDVGIDHSFVVPLTFITPDLDVPIVPITQNCNVPPRPRLERSYEVGRILGEAIRSGPDGRVVLVGTGGLSHWVGSEERRQYINRPAGTRIADRDEFPVDIDDTGPINVEWDRAFLQALAAGKVSSFIGDWPPERIEEEAGNGAHEIRNWVMAAAAAHDGPAELVAYEPVAEWLTGTGIVKFAA